MATTISKIPKLSMHTVRGGFSPLTPDEVNKLEYFFHRGGVRIAKVSPEIIVKYGSDVRVKEADTIDFIRENTQIPVPKIHAVYTHGPFDRPEFDAIDEYDTYIFMDYIEGETLEKMWPNFDEKDKVGIMDELKGHLEELRNMEGTYVGSLENGPVLDQILEYQPNKGPFTSVTEFHETLIDAYAKVYKGDVKPYLRGMLSTREHTIVFTHADFRPANIMVKDGHVVGIIDWEMSGWYPEWWEFAKAFFIWQFQNDWGSRFLEITPQYYCEQSAHGQMMQCLL
ncbi:hypothetical protein H072_2871 [Dactylellina haptotyla CBS 200.50]|uniref:Aminoglycoside phosphotransferase domain-containing protein n=1 Tax=Dactylellina haptotyla (strain CBS 200.50) TaxID=1284197 RepID=S8AJM9_DACHA|nr:hypothetical protein H072_2871 [Dactylellina haptotyla CBS 200.50]